MALSIGFRVSVSLRPAIQATGRLALAPAGLAPASRTCLSLDTRRVEDWRGARMGPSPAPAASNGANGFPVRRSPVCSRHGLCDLSTRSAFGRSPIADPIVSEEPEPFMEPHRTPPLPAEAATAPRPHQMAPHSLLDPQPHIRQAPTRVPDPEVVHPPPQDRVDLRDQPTHRS